MNLEVNETESFSFVIVINDVDASWYVVVVHWKRNFTKIAVSPQRDSNTQYLDSINLT